MSKSSVMRIATLLLTSTIFLNSINAYSIITPEAKCDEWPSAYCNGHDHVTFIQNNSNRTWFIKNFYFGCGEVLPFSDRYFQPNAMGRIMVNGSLMGSWPMLQCRSNYAVILSDGSHDVKLSAMVDWGVFHGYTITASSSQPALITHQLDKISDGKPGASLFVIN